MSEETPATLFSLDAEQAVIGGLLFDNAIADFMPALKAEHFFDPVHQLIFESAMKLIAEGGIASPVTVDAAMAGYAGYKDANGRRYLSSLAGNLPGLAGMADFAQIIIDLSVRRDLSTICAGILDRTQKAALSDSTDLMISSAEQAIRDLADRGFVKKTRWIGAGSSEWFDRAMTPPASGFQGVRSGLADFDNALGGLQSGDLIVLAGRPSMGKTALALSIARGVCANGVGVHMASLEMDCEKLWARMMSDVMRDRTSFPYTNIGRVAPFIDQQAELKTALDAVKQMPFSVDDTASASIEYVCSSARRAARKMETKGGNLGLIIVDYLQLINLSSNSNSNLAYAIGQLTKALKKLAKECGCAVIVLSQLSRAVETRDDKRPGLSDLRQSGEIEQDADVVGFIFRPEYYLERKDEPDPEKMEKARGVLRLFIDKNRNGAICAPRFDCDIKTNSVRNWGELFTRIGGF